MSDPAPTRALGAPGTQFIAEFSAQPCLRAAPFCGVVRTATPGDVAGCVDIAQQVRGGKPGAWLRQLQGQLAAADAVTYVALESGAVVGYASAAYQDGDEDGPAPTGHYLMGVTTAPSHRRRGVGRALTAARLEWIASRDTHAWYFANAANLASIALHREFGFTQVARAASFCGVPFTGGTGILFHAALG